MKGYQVVVVDDRDQYEAPGVYVRDVHRDFNDARDEFIEEINDAKTNTCGDFDWLAQAFEDYPNNIKEQWETDRWVIFSDIYSGDRLEIYIIEVNIN